MKDEFAEIPVNGREANYESSMASFCFVSKDEK